MSASVEQLGIRRGGREMARSFATLRHAIEYLSDQYVESDGAAADQKGILEAVHLLMGLHQQVYSGESDPASPGLHEPFWARILAG